MATPAKKEKKALKILDKWFLDPEISDVFKCNHSKNAKVSLHCLLCDSLKVQILANKQVSLKKKLLDF